MPSIIKNYKTLASSKKRKIALDIIDAGIKSVLPMNVMKNTISYDKKRRILTIKHKSYRIKGRIFVIGAGKASGLMAERLEKIIGVKNITAGIVACKDDNYNTQKIKVIKSNHPIPNKTNLVVTEKILALKNNYDITKDDLIIGLISGGGSALLTDPEDEINLSDIQSMTKLMMSCGCDIHEINTIRKHLSKIKGGKLGLHFAPTKIVSLIISDVIGDELDVIASGLTVKDNSTFQDAYNIIKKYNLLSKISKNIINYFNHELKNSDRETPTKLINCKNYLIANNKLAVDTMKQKAIDLGLKPKVITYNLIGCPIQRSDEISHSIKSGVYSQYNVLIAGGETTPILSTISGKGGRNQEFIIASLNEMIDYDKEFVIASVGTDGSDYLKDVAGGIIDQNSIEIVKRKNIDLKKHLDKSDCYDVLVKLRNSIVKTGPTGTNVCDIVIYLI